MTFPFCLPHTIALLRRHAHGDKCASIPRQFKQFLAVPRLDDCRDGPVLSVAWRDNGHLCILMLVLGGAK